MGCILELFDPIVVLFILKELISINVSEVADNSSSSDRAYSTEEYLKITEEQLKAAAQQQNETSTPEQILYNAQNPQG